MLCELCKSASRWAQRDHHLWPIIGVGIEFRTPRPIVVVPDLVILNTRPTGHVFTPDQVALVAEVWSPEDSADDRARRFGLYQQAKIRYCWTVDLDGPVIKTYEYVDDAYQHRDTLRGRKIHEVTTAPIPVMAQAALLAPRVSA